MFKAARVKFPVYVFVGAAAALLVASPRAATFVKWTGRPFQMMC